MKDLDYSFSMEDLSTLECEFDIEGNPEVVDFDEFLNIGDGVQLMTPPTTEGHHDFPNENLRHRQKDSPAIARLMDQFGDYHIYGRDSSSSVVTPSLVPSADTLDNGAQVHPAGNINDCNDIDTVVGKLGDVDLSTVLKLRSRNLQLRRSKSAISVYQRPRYRSHSTSNLQTPPSSSALTPNPNAKVKKNPFYSPSGKVLKIIEKEKQKQGDPSK